MRSRLFAITLCLVLASLMAFGQAGTGTITGVVTDQTGAVVAGANVSAKNSETGVVFPAASSNTGNYTLTQLPPGTYEIDVKVQGFKEYVHKNLQVQVAGIIREDVGLTIGSATGDIITVTAEASLLKTESGDLAHNITVGQLDDLPILGVGNTNAGSSGIRNPYGLAQLIPGVQYAANSVMTINGQGGVNAPTAAMRIEGQDMTNHYVSYALQEEQPSADAIQEVAVQTSNYAPEFGTAGSAVFNITMKSGTNQYHGSGYDYFVNEDLNAGTPGSISSISGDKIRGRNRRNDYGGTLGGPVWIPKIYNGHNKTFFFYNWEQFREKTGLFFGSDTVPVPAYLAGNFSAISPNGNCSLCSAYGVQTTALGNGIKDAQGNQFFSNTIYDPTTRGVVNGLGFANPFPNNTIPTARLDPVALKIQALFPAAQNANLTSNYASAVPSVRLTTIPSWKFDESLTSKDKFSFYYSTTGTASQISSPNGNADGLPFEIGAYRGTFIDSKIVRLNYDRTITPTLLLHIGAGWQRLNFFDDAPFLNFNPTAFGLSGFLIGRQFPNVTGLCPAGIAPAGCGTTVGANLGGMQAVGTVGQIQSHSRQQKPSYNLNATYVKGSHTFKVGGEVYFQGTIANPFSGVTLATGTGQTSQPFTPTVSFNGFSTGFGYASFLLGDYLSTNQTPLTDTREGKSAWAFFAQDSWKVTRKLTLDYGVRYDLDTALREQYGRVGRFAPLVANANAGGHLGATEYAATCGCDFYPSAYKFGLGPRIGLAYQVNSKTVIRGGWGVVYQFNSDTAYPTVSTPGTNAPAGINPVVNIETPGAIFTPVWPIVNNPNIYPNVGTTNAAPTMLDANTYRPPRQNQFSFGIQREISRDLVVEASYVGNRLVWLPGPLGFLNQISPAQYAAFGLHPYTTYSDYQLLGQAINSPAVEQKMAAAGVGNGGLLLPYATAPLSTTLQNALRSFPQFPNLTPGGSATGKSKYDSLQVKVTKRMSHGLSANGTFTWSKSEVLNARQDFFNPNSSDYVLNTNNQPILVNMNITYTTPKATSNRYVATAVKDWQLGIFAQYGSGQMLTPPTSTLNSLFLASEDYRVPGQPLYLKDLNCHCINPGYDQVLNPAAWAAVPANGVGPAIGTVYSDFRGPRRPQENFNIGRNFRFKERYNLQIRGEFVNIFNRVYYQPPSTTAPQTAAILGGTTKASSGFGTINAFAAVNGVPSLFQGPRTGTIIARFSF